VSTSHATFRFLIVVPSWNSMRWLPQTLDSIRRQTDPAYEVCVVDDASDDETQAAFIARYCAEAGWRQILNERHQGALRNQYEAVHALDPSPDDVIVFVDGDDRLAHERVLEQLRRYYAQGPLLTYGSYVSDPPDPRVVPALPLPYSTVREATYRAFTLRDDDSTWFNHLRTVKFEIFNQLDPRTDFQLPDGTWFTSCADIAVMIPCLELIAGRFRWIPEILYVYTRNNPRSDCYVRPRETGRMMEYILGELPPKQPLFPLDIPQGGYGLRVDDPPRFL
jgi:glycosyltransferase involved in cell wall biosynthesis